MPGSNTISIKTYRDSYRQKALAKLLRKAQVAEAICNVDRSGSKTIQNPYGSQPTATVQVITGNYTVSTYQTTDDTLTVLHEVIYAEQVYDFEMVLTRPDVWASRIDEQNYSISIAADKYVLNEMVRQAGQTYVTPSGGFVTAANLPVIVSNLLSLVAGYTSGSGGYYLVLENTDLVGVIQQQLGSGFSFADARLRNGFANSYAGVDLYIVRSGTFQNYTAGSIGFQNQSKRLFGVKGVATYAAPRAIRTKEIEVSGKTGKELATWCYIAAKVWAVNSAFTVAVVLTNSPSPSPSVSPSASVSPSSSASSSPSPS